MSHVASWGAAVLLGLASPAPEQEPRPQWRGPARDGVVEDLALRASWARSHGPGPTATPALAGVRLYTLALWRLP